MTEAAQPRVQKRAPSRVALGEHVRHTHYLLPHEEALVDLQLEGFADKQAELNELMRDAVEQSSETTHDNAPRDVVVDAQGTIMAVAQHVIQIKRDREIIDYPEAQDPKITIGSRVQIGLDGMEPFFVDILGFPPLEEDDEVVPVTYTAPLAAALLGHAAGEQFQADINGQTKMIGVVAVDQVAIRAQFTPVKDSHED